MSEKIRFKAAAKIIGCATGTLRNNYRKWGVPFYKIGGRVEFSPHELYGWIECQRHNSLDNDELVAK